MTQDAEFQTSLISYIAEHVHQLAIVSDHTLPYCMLVELDVVSDQCINLDFQLNMCKQNNRVVAPLLTPY